MSDQLTDGRRFRVLTVGYDSTRELDALISERGRRPDTIISDNGTEFTSNGIPQWAYRSVINWHYIAPGKRKQGGFIGELKVG